MRCGDVGLVVGVLLLARLTAVAIPPVSTTAAAAATRAMTRVVGRRRVGGVTGGWSALGAVGAVIGTDCWSLLSPGVTIRTLWLPVSGRSLERLVMNYS